AASWSREVAAVEPAVARADHEPAAPRLEGDAVQAAEVAQPRGASQLGDPRVPEAGLTVEPDRDEVVAGRERGVERRAETLRQVHPADPVDSDGEEADDVQARGAHGQVALRAQR